MCTTDPKKPEHPHSHALTRQAALLLCGTLLALRLDVAAADNTPSPAAARKARNAPEAAAAAPADDARLRFDIPRGNAPERLNEYSTQSGFQVLYMFEDMNGITTNRVRGRLTPHEAMEALTRGTRIRYRFVNTKTITLTALPPPPLPMVVDASEDRRSRASAVEQVTITAPPYRNSIAQLGSRLITVNRVDIDALGAATVQDVLRTVPQIFGGGPSEDTRIGIEAESNATLGYGVNLRGLGAGSTLVLVNGRRLAGSGTRGMFADVSNVPLSLVDHIEILADGGSVRYGADAAGGVVNFVLKRAPGYLQTDGMFGTATKGSLHEVQLSQLAGIETPRLDATFAVDYYSRENLPARDRALAGSNLARFGGTDFRTSQSNPGTIVIGARTWRIPAGQNGTNLEPADLVPDQQNLEDPWAESDLLPTQKRLSLYASGGSILSDDSRVFVDALYSKRDLRATSAGARILLTVPSSNAFYVNPTGTDDPIQVGYSFADDLGPMRLTGESDALSLTGGAELGLGTWHISMAADYASERARTRQDNSFDPVVLGEALSDSNPETALNVFGDGSNTNPATLDRLRTADLYRAESEVFSVSATGATEKLFGGERFELTAGAAFRIEEFGSVLRNLSRSRYADEWNDRKVFSGFGSASLPLGKTVELFVGGRYEHYSDFGTTLSPRFGATWRALANLTVRATWSESYRPPNLVDLDETENVVLLTALPDATASGESLALVRIGRNAGLREERAATSTVGLEFKPVSQPGLSLAATYFDTRFRDRIDLPMASSNVLTDPAFSDLVVRNYTQEQLSAACSSARFAGPSGLGCTQAPIAAIVDMRMRNTAYLRTSGIDLNAEHIWHLGRHTLKAGVQGTYLFSFRNAPSRLLPPRERVSTQNNPIDLRLEGALDWSFRRLIANLRWHYYDNYRNLADASARHVSAWSTFDLRFAYRPSEAAPAPLTNTTWSLSVENVFDTSAPFLNNPAGVGYDQENGDLIGRMISVGFQKRW